MLYQRIEITLLAPKWQKNEIFLNVFKILHPDNDLYYNYNQLYFATLLTPKSGKESRQDEHTRFKVEYMVRSRNLI